MWAEVAPLDTLLQLGILFAHEFAQLNGDRYVSRNSKCTGEARGGRSKQLAKNCTEVTCTCFDLRPEAESCA